ncbi:MAG: hypothetical protein HYR97_01910 [Candidatus Melainabacteria bacterium]|nr:hypothetical protein [Candidatus Melainabacteria bacterium]
MFVLKVDIASTGQASAPTGGVSQGTNTAPAGGTAPTSGTKEAFEAVSTEQGNLRVQAPQGSTADDSSGSIEEVKANIAQHERSIGELKGLEKAATAANKQLKESAQKLKTEAQEMKTKGKQMVDEGNQSKQEHTEQIGQQRTKKQDAHTAQAVAQMKKKLRQMKQQQMRKSLS